MSSHTAPTSSRRSSSYTSRMSPIAGSSSTARQLPSSPPTKHTRVLDAEIIEEWDGPDSSFLGTSDGGKRKIRVKGKKKKDEPMKPTTVILYVVFFYIVWQILTRPSESEILSHLSPSSPHHYHYSQLPESSSSGSNPYQFPYQFPHIPSQFPPSASSSSSTSDTSPSVTRIILSWIFYPFYLLLFPLTLILNIGYLLFSILKTLLVPFTSTGRILAQLLVVTPYSWAAAFGRAIYPIYVFVGGMLGVGCVMGLGAGWASKKSLEIIVARIKGGKEKVAKPSRPERDHTDEQGYRFTRHPDLVHRAEQQNIRSKPSVRYSIGSSESDEEVYTNPRTPVRSRRVPSVYPHDSVSKRGDHKGKMVEGGMGTSREGIVVGTRRRGVRYDDD